MSVRDGALRWDINGCRVKPPDSFENVRASGSGTAQVVRMNRRRKSVSISVFLVLLIGILGCIEVEAQPGGDRILSGRSGFCLLRPRLRRNEEWVGERVTAVIC